MRTFLFVYLCVSFVLGAAVAMTARAPIARGYGLGHVVVAPLLLAVMLFW